MIPLAFTITNMLLLVNHIFKYLHIYIFLNSIHFFFEENLAARFSFGSSTKIWKDIYVGSLEKPFFSSYIYLSARESKASEAGELVFS